MTTVTGLTAERMLEMEAATIIDANIVGDDLILVTRDATEINVGSVRGIQGIQGIAGTNGTNGSNGAAGPGLYAFANAAARDAAIPAPTEGMTCFLQNLDQLLVYRGTAWLPPWNLPWGELARQELPASTVNVTASAMTNVGILVTWDAVAGRLYEVRASLGFVGVASGTPGTTKVVIADNADVTKCTVINASLSATGPGSRISGERGLPLAGLAAGSTTYRLRAQCGSGSIDITASAGDPGPTWIAVRDLGPA